MTAELDFDAPQQDAAPHQVRLSTAQTAAARARVAQFPSGWTYWTPGEDAPFYGTRAEAEAASVQEWRDNLEAI